MQKRLAITERLTQLGADGVVLERERNGRSTGDSKPASAIARSTERLGARAAGNPQRAQSLSNPPARSLLSMRSAFPDGTFQAQPPAVARGGRKEASADENTPIADRRHGEPAGSLVSVWSVHSRCAVAATGFVRSDERVGITVAANPTAA